ncbi:hypothetical protein PVAP13_9NG818800 [Panicum virgatum]|uniref:Uncharacterized protein n=1 Tax=Panicum virgatum TaxID=38727 RepID=A0A8T0N1T0_PANVG|nr:hypothetical protein PVAP13_9NG818800 [Panicum virgatum]KAG2542823.1 hypothetical protein PVAP13_9NG818800 [Panicum virgatum]
MKASVRRHRPAWWPARRPLRRCGAPAKASRCTARSNHVQLPASGHGRLASARSRHGGPNPDPAVVDPDSAERAHSQAPWLPETNLIGCRRQQRVLLCGYRAIRLHVDR